MKNIFILIFLLFASTSDASTNTWGRFPLSENTNIDYPTAADFQVLGSAAIERFKALGWEYYGDINLTQPVVIRTYTNGYYTGTNWHGGTFSVTNYTATNFSYVIPGVTNATVDYPSIRCLESIDNALKYLSFGSWGDGVWVDADYYTNAGTSLFNDMSTGGVHDLTNYALSDFLKTNGLGVTMDGVTWSFSEEPKYTQSYVLVSFRASVVSNTLATQVVAAVTSLVSLAHVRFVRVPYSPADLSHITPASVPTSTFMRVNLSDSNYSDFASMAFTFPYAEWMDASNSITTRVVTNAVFTATGLETAMDHAYSWLSYGSSPWYRIETNGVTTNTMIGTLVQFVWESNQQQLNTPAWWDGASWHYSAFPMLSKKALDERYLYLKKFRWVNPTLDNSSSYRKYNSMVRPCYTASVTSIGTIPVVNQDTNYTYNFNYFGLGTTWGTYIASYRENSGSGAGTLDIDCSGWGSDDTVHTNCGDLNFQFEYWPVTGYQGSKTFTWFSNMLTMVANPDATARVYVVYSYTNAFENMAIDDALWRVKQPCNFFFTEEASTTVARASCWLMDVLPSTPNDTLMSYDKGIETNVYFATNFLTQHNFDFVQGADLLTVKTLASPIWSRSVSDSTNYEYCSSTTWTQGNYICTMTCTYAAAVSGNETIKAYPYLNYRLNVFDVIIKYDVPGGFKYQ